MTEKTQKTTTANEDKTTWSETPWLVLKGFLMGAADIIPGVSGGTMALITGIYDRLIHAIRSVDKQMVLSLFSLRFRELLVVFHWRFLLLLFSGIASAIFFFTRIVPLQVYMFTHPEVVYGLFFGLILGSILVLLKEVDRNEYGFRTLLPLLAGTLTGFWIVTLVPAETPEHFLFLFFSGAVAFLALLLPGISGSYFLLILGKYDYVLMLLGQLGSDQTVPALLSLLPLALGGITSLIIFSRIISWLLTHYHTLTLMVLIGFLIGSLYIIWPWQERIYSETVTETVTLPIQDPRVQELEENPPGERSPEFLRLGEVINPQAPADEQQVRIEQVSRDLVDSTPFIPGLVDQEQDYNLAGGGVGLLIGLALVGGLDYLRRKN